MKYTFRYSEAGEILNAMASVLLGAIKSVTVPIQQEFQITFLQVCNSTLFIFSWKDYNLQTGSNSFVYIHWQDISSTSVLQFSGNPGYAVGRPLVAGTRTAEYPLL